MPHWDVYDLSDDVHAVIANIYDLAQEDTVDLEAWRSEGGYIVVESNAPVYKVERVLDQVGENYERVG